MSSPLPSTQINDFSQNSKHYKIELVTGLGPIQYQFNNNNSQDRVESSLRTTETTCHIIIAFLKHIHTKPQFVTDVAKKIPSNQRAFWIRQNLNNQLRVVSAIWNIVSNKKTYVKEMTLQTCQKLATYSTQMDYCFSMLWNFFCKWMV